MQIRNILALNEQGKRGNNEDSIFPPKNAANKTNDRFFLVCDGMGGHENGEVASDAVCQTFGAILKNTSPDVFNKQLFEQTLIAAYDELDNKDANPGVKKKMGTTFTFLHLNDKQAFVAHIGDSRIYHLRKNAGGVDIMYKSADHSLVNELLTAGIITEEEAAIHPKKNVITRAMQPHAKKRFDADIYTTADVKTNDLFFLCTDGVVESVSDKTLCDIVAQSTDDKQIIDAILTMCNKNSKDNFSAYLVSIDEGISNDIPVAIVEDVPIILANDGSYEPVDDTDSPPGKKRSNIFFLIILITTLAAFAVYNMMKKDKTPESVIFQQSDTKLN
jgi:protein phosphatase